MHVAVFGGTRNTGQAFVEQALEKGDIEMTLLVRNPDNLPYTKEQLNKLNIIKGDATNKFDIAKTLENADIVVSSLGMTPSILTGKHKDQGIDEIGTINIIEVIQEAHKANSPRFIMISSTGIGTQKDVPFLLRPLYSLLLSTPHNHKTVAESALKKSGIDHIIVRPALLTNGKLTQKYRSGLGLSGYTISRKDTAHFVLHQCVIENKWINQDPIVVY